MLQIEAEQEQQPAAAAPVVPPSPLAAAVWLACKLLHALNVLLLPRCYPILWQQQQKQQQEQQELSPSTAFAGALMILTRAAACSSPFIPGAIPSMMQDHQNAAHEGTTEVSSTAAAAAAARRQHQRYWMEQSLFVVGLPLRVAFSAAYEPPTAVDACVSLCLCSNRH